VDATLTTAPAATSAFWSLFGPRGPLSEASILTGPSNVSLADGVATTAFSFTSTQLPLTMASLTAYSSTLVRFSAVVAVADTVR
jgi:hypothetical protein